MRVLDVSHNFIGSEAAQAVADALTHNHSLLWLQMLPQWSELHRSVEVSLGSALSSRRIKLDLAVRAARGVLSSRGDVGEPSVAFEWQGAHLTTGTAHPVAYTLNPKWDEHFTLCIPASVLWPPSRTPLALSVTDLRRSAQLASDPPMGSCELPLAALLLAESSSIGLRCPILRHSSAAPTNRSASAELLLELTTLHVGDACADDGAPGVPHAYRHALTEAKRSELRAAQQRQAAQEENMRLSARKDLVQPEAMDAGAIQEGEGEMHNDDEHMWELFRLGWSEFLGDPWGSIRRLMLGMGRDKEEGEEGLLPNGAPRSDEELGVPEDEYDEDEDEHRRLQLLRIALCLFCMTVTVLVAAAAVLFILAHT
jgi:hypothetical protein